MLLAFGLGLLLLNSPVASAQVIVRGGYYAPPRAYYGPRCYYPPRTAAVYAPPPVVVVPAPYYAPRAYYVPRPYGYRGRGHGRRW